MAGLINWLDFRKSVRLPETGNPRDQVILPDSVVEQQSREASELGNSHQNILNQFQRLDDVLAQFENVREFVVKARGSLDDIFADHRTHRAENLALRSIIEQTSQSLSQSREQETQLRIRISALEIDVSGLAEELSNREVIIRGNQEEISLLKSHTMKQSARLNEIEQQLEEKNDEIEILQTENVSIRDREMFAEQQINQLSADNRLLNEKNSSLREELANLEQMFTNNSIELNNYSQRLAHAETELINRMNQVTSLKQTLAEAENERTRLLAQLDEISTTSASEKRTYEGRVEALIKRNEMLEKLLADARNEVNARSEAFRAAERGQVELKGTIRRLEKTTEKMTLDQENLQNEIRNLEQARAALKDRTNMLEKANKAKDAVISQNEDKMAQLSEQLSRSEHKNRLSMEAQSKRIAELITELEREKSERGLAEGRLESVRKERTRLQLELSTLRARYMDDGNFNSSDEDDGDGLPRNSGNIKSFRPDPV